MKLHRPDSDVEPHGESHDNTFRYSIWDLLVFTSALSCFAAVARWIGLFSVLLVPGFLIAPSVLAHPRNTPLVKIWFAGVLFFLTLALYRMNVR
jgi:hypothetical protein